MSPRKIDDALKTEVVERFVAGETRKALALTYGVDEGTVYQWLKKCGIDANRERRAWTNAEEELIIQLRADSVPFREIAVRVGRTKGAVTKQVEALVAVGRALPLTPSERSFRGGQANALFRTDLWRPEEDAEIIRLWTSGVRATEIAKQLGRPMGSTEGRIHQLRTTGRVRHLTPEERRERERQVKSERTEAALVKARQRVEGLPNTADLGYLVGVLYGDGFIHQRDKSFGVRTTNSSFASAVGDAMDRALSAASFRTKRLQDKKVGGREYKNVMYYEAMLYESHLGAALMEMTGDTRTYQWKIDVEKSLARGVDYCRGVIQGLYDSDGSITLVGNRGLVVRLGTASAEGAESLHRLMREMGFDVHLAPPNRKKEHKVSLRAASSVKYAEEISSRIDYKKATMEEFLRRWDTIPAWSRVRPDADTEAQMPPRSNRIGADAETPSAVTDTLQVPVTAPRVPTAQVLVEAPRIPMTRIRHVPQRIKKILPKRRPIVVWTEEEDAQIVKLRSDGIVSSEIAVRLNRPDHRVKARIRTLLMEGRTHRLAANATVSSEKVVEIRQRYASGVTQTVLAEELGVDRSTISAIVQGKNWGHVPGATHTPRATISQNTKNEIRRLAQAGWTGKKISAAVSLKESTVHNVLAGFKQREAGGRVRAPVTAEQRVDILQRLAAGERSENVGKALGLTRRVVAKIRQHYSGLPVDPVSRKVDNQSLRDEVTRGYREGKTRDALALEFDVHRVTVANWLQESGDRQKKVKPESVSLTQEQRAEIIRQHTAGASQQAIAKEFGILSSRVSKIVVKAAGKEPQKRRAPVKLTPEQVAEIQRRYAAGDGQRNIAKDFEIDQTRVSDIVRGQDRTTRGGPKMNRPDRLTPEQRVEVEQRLRSQESQTDIARDFDVSQAVISMIKLKAGIETRAQRGPRTTLPPLTDEQRAEILRRLAAGERQVVIAEALGTTQGRVSSVKREAGL